LWCELWLYDCQVTAAALASENKAYAHPASVDSLPTSETKKITLLLATFAARRLKDMRKIPWYFGPVEILSAVQVWIP